MTRKYKSSYKGNRGVKRFQVTFDNVQQSERVEVCTMCGEKVEESPMMRGVCYDCYRITISTDPRTPEQRDLDQWQAETEATRASDYPM